jgi:hypothetical protein
VAAAPDTAPPEKATARRRWATLPLFGRAPEVLALSCVGVLLVAWAYARARTGGPHAMPLYWTGQVVVFVPVAARMLSRRLTGGPEAFALVIGLAVNQYLLKWAYSPEQFRFPDELQHWASTATLVETGQLFHTNHALPAAVHFPALEEICAAVVAMTGLSITTAGLLVAGVAHLVFVGAVFMLARRTGTSTAVAGLACVIYATGMHYLFFDSMYIYQTAALPFLVLAIWASRCWRVSDRRTWPFGLLGLASIALVGVSHHITAFFTIGALALIAACELGFGGKPRQWATLVLAVVAAASIAAWIWLVARDVVDYLAEPMSAIINTHRQLTDRSGSNVQSGSDTPLWPLAVQAAGLLVLLIAFARIGYLAVRSRQRDPWQWALFAGGLLFFGSNGLRLVGAQGPELAGRAVTFTYLPMSLLAAAAVPGWRRRGNRLYRAFANRTAVGTLALTLLMVGARGGGWPPSWAQLPGPYLVSGYERSIDPAGVSAARWMARRLPRGQRVAADSTGWTLSSTYGREDPVGEASALYYATTWNAATQQLSWDLDINVVWVDLRMSQQTPKSGAYFAQDPQAYTHKTPISRSLLTKFDQVPGISRIYDGGPIRLYGLRD